MNSGIAVVQGLWVEQEIIMKQYFRGPRLCSPIIRTCLPLLSPRPGIVKRLLSHSVPQFPH